MENRIKEQLSLFADRMSAETLRANQLRLYLSSFAYVLVHALRRLGLAGHPVGASPGQHHSFAATEDRCRGAHQRPPYLRALPARLSLETAVRRGLVGAALLSLPRPASNLIFRRSRGPRTPPIARAAPQPWLSPLPNPRNPPFSLAGPPSLAPSRPLRRPPIMW